MVTERNKQSAQKVTQLYGSNELQAQTKHKLRDKVANQGGGQKYQEPIQIPKEAYNYLLSLKNSTLMEKVKLGEQSKHENPDSPLKKFLRKEIMQIDNPSVALEKMDMIGSPNAGKSIYNE